MIEKHLRTLFGLLEEELSLYKDLLAISQKKTDVIVKRDIKRLENMTRFEQELILLIGKKEDKRFETLMKLGEILDIDPNKATISQLLEHVEPQHKDRWMKLQKDIDEVLSSLKNINNTNNRLINKALEYINKNINILAGVYAESPTYNKDKKGRSSTTRSFFDQKV
ncbi:MAG: hypothetical protein PWQ82_1027 [Thermosediminibacterales bacterium]|nr:hypothetical protein [Thermosediminibacterales bacterium]